MNERDPSPKAASFADLYRNHAPAVYRFALGLSGNPTLAEDIVSETFLRIWDSSATIRRETVQGYLFTIARNVFLHDLRHRQRQEPLGDNHTVPTTVVAQLESRQHLATTLAALQTLPEIDRAALLLRSEEGTSYEEIARVLGLSLSAAKVKIHRARLKLAEHGNKGAIHGTD
jgi:RNA polymerase sigma-70 factor, ECF subfamily